MNAHNLIVIQLGCANQGKTAPIDGGDGKASLLVWHLPHG
jgi:hypothetical protein